MRDQVFDAFNLISILSFLKTFMTAYDSNRSSEDAAVELVYHFMKDLLTVIFSFLIQLRMSKASKLNKRNGSLFPCAEVVNHLLGKYAAKNVIANTVSDIYLFTHGPSMTTMVYSSAFKTKVLHCGKVFNENKLTELFIEGLWLSFLHNMQAYCGTNKKASMQTMARHADSLRRHHAGMTYAEDVNRQRRQGRAKPRKNPPRTRCAVLWNNLEQKVFEVVSGKTIGEEFAVESGTGSSSRDRRTRTASLATKAIDASFCQFCP